jgi:hypothetical protein
MKLRYLLLFAAVSVLSGVSFFEVVGGSRYSRLLKEGVQQSGFIVGTDCSNHGKFRYRFDANNTTFTGTGNQGAPHPCRELTAGDVVIVHFLPTDPTINISGDPQKGLSDALFGACVASLIFPLGIVGSIQKFMRARRK